MNFPFTRHALWLAMAGSTLAVSPLHAQLANWTVVSSENIIIPTAGFPSNVAPNFFAIALAMLDVAWSLGCFRVATPPATMRVLTAYLRNTCNLTSQTRWAQAALVPKQATCFGR